MINKRQKAQLRALANTIKPMGYIGKDGLNENLFKALDEILKKYELIKVKVHKTCTTSINELTIEITRVLHCDLVQSIGYVMVFYRRNREKQGIDLVK